MTAIAVTNFDIDAMRTGSSAVTARPDERSANPSSITGRMDALSNKTLTAAGGGAASAFPAKNDVKQAAKSDLIGF